MADNLWYVGAILVLFGTICQNLGNNIVSVAHSNRHKEEELEVEEAVGVLVTVPDGGEDDDDVKKPTGEDDKMITKEEEEEEQTWLHRHLWAIGSTIFVTGSLTNFVSFGYAAQSLLASLQSIQFVSNMIFAKVVHNEEVSYTMMGATGSIVAGNVLVVIFSEHSAVKYTGTEIFNLWATNTAFHIYLGVMGSVAVACECTYRHYNYCRMVESKLLWMHSFIESACYCTASSFIGTLAVMNAKCLSMYLTGDQPGVEFSSAPLYVALFVWLSFVTFWFRRMDHGLNLFPPLFFIPVLMISFVFINIIAGGIFFKEFELFDDSQYAGFCVGAFMILVGVYFLAPANDMDIGPSAEPAEVEGEGLVVADIEMAPMSRKPSVRKMSHRLSFKHSPSFSAVDSSSDKTARTMSTTQSPSSKDKESPGSGRSRAGTMRQPHPLAALKETSRRISVVGTATKTVDDALEGMERRTRSMSNRLSVVLGRTAASSSMDSADPTNTLNVGAPARKKLHSADSADSSQTGDNLRERFASIDEEEGQTEAAGSEALTQA